MRFVGIMAFSLMAGPVLADETTMGASQPNAAGGETAPVLQFVEDECVVTSADGVVISTNGLPVRCNATSQGDGSDRARVSRFQDEEIDSSFDGRGSD